MIGGTKLREVKSPAQHHCTAPGRAPNTWSQAHPELATSPWLSPPGTTEVTKVCPRLRDLSASSLVLTPARLSGRQRVWTHSVPGQQIQLLLPTSLLLTRAAAPVVSDNPDPAEGSPTPAWCCPAPRELLKSGGGSQTLSTEITAQGPKICPKGYYTQKKMLSSRGKHRFRERSQLQRTNPAGIHSYEMNTNSGDRWWLPLDMTVLMLLKGHLKMVRTVIFQLRASDRNLMKLGNEKHSLRKKILSVTDTPQGTVLPVEKESPGWSQEWEERSPLVISCAQPPPTRERGTAL
ncbi:uncharacterized protein LOC131812984 [Mustela lutreola]|uniref:uncharacterized protein LOC131812984 n=1 Tax=Mustela lutreola TaxID=9666 RepID=UPI0027979E63|nr:uncharacterized protein LOC131812984 [Mustela lutreola]